MTEQEYHALKHLSKSAIDLLLSCPAHYKAWLENADEHKSTPAMDFGRAFHKLTLEPQDFCAEFTVTDLSMSTKEGKAFKAALPAGVQILKEEDYTKAQLMADAVREHPQAKFLFQNYEAEKTILWEHDTIQCKARIDILASIHGRLFAADLKSCESANPADLPKHIANYGYHRQAWWYMDGLKRLGTPAEAFLFIFVEKSYPHLVTIVQMDDAAMNKAGDECLRAVDTLKQCRETHLYPCYTRDILTISLPKWAA